MFPSLSGPSWGHTFRRKAAKPCLLSLLGRSGRTSRHESPDRLVDDSQVPSQAAQFSKGSALSLEPQSSGLPWFPLRPPFPPLLPPGIISAPAFTPSKAQTPGHTCASSSSVTTPTTGIWRGLLNLIVLPGARACAVAAASAVDMAVRRSEGWGMSSCPTLCLQPRDCKRPRHREVKASWEPLESRKVLGVRPWTRPPRRHPHPAEAAHRRT